MEILKPLFFSNLLNKKLSRNVSRVKLLRLNVKEKEEIELNGLNPVFEVFLVTLFANEIQVLFPNFIVEYNPISLTF